jgi:two-component system phosphate regulon sensor histidine kinase PhoR
VAFRLHSRLVILIAGAIAVFALLLGHFLSNSLTSWFSSEIGDQLYRSALLAESNLRLRAHDNPAHVAQDLSKALNVRVTIIANNQVVADADIASEANPNLDNDVDQPEVRHALDEGHGSDTRRLSTGVPFIFVATKLDDGRVLRLGRPLTSLETFAEEFRHQIALAALAGIIITLAFGYLVYVGVSLPLQRLAQASSELAAGNLNSELAVTGDRDLMAVSSSLNTMAKSLRRKIEDLENDKRRTEAIMASITAGIVVFDRQALVVFTNHFMGQLLGTHGEFIGRAPLELIRHAALETAVRDALRRGEASAFDLTTGTGRDLLAKAAPVRGLSGDVEMVVVVFHDLTEIRRTEKMRKDFIANVSHEFKTPLTSIRGYAETLLNAPPKEPELSRDFLEAIERNAALLQALVEDLLILARLESEAPVHKTPLNIHALIEEQVDSRDQLINDKNIEVMVQCPDIDILVDRSRLARTISNLLDNAIHYNKPGGQIRISGKQEARGFTLDIADTGIGIRQEDQARIFERFYRVEKSRSRESGGTGLGLAIAKHAIESQGGTISVASKLGAGSTFTIFLPNSH